MKRENQRKESGPGFDRNDTMQLEIRDHLAKLNQQVPPDVSDLDFEAALSTDEDESD